MGLSIIVYIVIIIFGLIAAIIDFLMQKVIECKRYTTYANVFYVFGFMVGMIIALIDK